MAAPRDRPAGCVHRADRECGARSRAGQEPGWSAGGVAAATTAAAIVAAKEAPGADAAAAELGFEPGLLLVLPPPAAAAAGAATAGGPAPAGAGPSARLHQPRRLRPAAGDRA